MGWSDQAEYGLSFHCLDSKLWYLHHNRPISQMRATLAACRELALDYNTYP